MSSLRLRVRASDCDQFGHVNNAIYLDFLEHTVATTLASAGWTNDWHSTGNHIWALKSLQIEFRHPAKFGDELLASLWLEDHNEITPTFGFEIRLSGSDTSESPANIVTRARSEWQRLNRESGESSLLATEMLDKLSTSKGSLPRPHSLPTDSARVNSYRWDHKVMRSEVAPSGKVHPRAIFNWVEEAVFSACGQAGWPTQRLRQADFMTFQTRHDSEFMSLPSINDLIRVESRLIDVRRLRGTWCHLIYASNQAEPVIRDYTTGVFLNRAGRPSSPPPGLMDDIQFGLRRAT